MRELRFDGRVAVITGAGRGLGRSYALLLAAKGAKVVVNDLGSSVRGDSVEADPAAEVVAEIEAAGGTAVACTAGGGPAPGGAGVMGPAGGRDGRRGIRGHNAG
uniref:SDR family NAD(P)-dependent oxidoreductase n=1 Tax=Nocardia asiatica TaxID=209252 RepID=UPI002457A0D5